MSDTNTLVNKIYKFDFISLLLFTTHCSFVILHRKSFNIFLGIFNLKHFFCICTVLYAISFYCVEGAKLCPM